MGKPRNQPAPPMGRQPSPATEYFNPDGRPEVTYAARRLANRADWLQLPAGALVLVAAVRPPLLPPVPLDGIYYGGTVTSNELRTGGPLWLRHYEPETWHPGWPLTALRELWVLEAWQADPGEIFTPLVSL